MQKSDLIILEDLLFHYIKDNERDNYFSLIKNEDYKSALLNGVNKILIYENNYEIVLYEFLESYKIKDYFIGIKNIKTNYIEVLAELYVKGNKNESINHLIKINDQAFVEATEFLNYLKNIFFLEGRKELKTHLIKLENLENFELSDTDIKLGIKNEARESLKFRFNKIEKEKKKYIKEEEALAQFSKERIPGIQYRIKNNISTNFLKIHTKGNSKIGSYSKYALAAAFIGVIILSTIIYTFNSKKNGSELAIIKFNKTTDNIIHQSRDSNIIINNEKNNVARNETSNGSPNKSNQIDTNIIPQTAIQKNDDVALRSIGDLSEEDNLIVNLQNPEKHIKIKYLPNKSEMVYYKFNLKNNEVKIYQKNKQIIQGYLEINNHIYLKIDEKYYMIKSTEIPLILSKIENLEILK